ncbi:hypothetical protein PNEG_02479 [Pneumocystis murina B123]|uniref:DASH complex subunit DAD2 n=1 Tax=Pneumocystis murina (strain B123) TaxID=1069680 RepID=M7NPU9_PNEMU|nr:hypothetical protein PNEG_02479 [Pneumocystis murina B123]EMR09136.1 hypothetical protein PNEG_02479 [Pneumocystis murina B123]
MSGNSSLSYRRQASSSFVPAHLQPNSALAAKIQEKKQEYENLSQLRDFSGKLVTQMEQLEKKMEILVGGTEVVASVLENWQNVFRTINISSERLQKKTVSNKNEGLDLPETLVRIPTS